MAEDMLFFGPFQLDLASRSLSRDGQPVRLGNRAHDILCVLATARGAVISKDELMARVWPGLVVEENNIQVHVSALRKVFNADKDRLSCIVTVPGHGYRRLGISDASATANQPLAKTNPALPDKPSIAVLPFTNLSGNPDQEYFAEGMVEDLITNLSRLRWLFVIARNSTFTYKGRAVDVRQVGAELGVR